MKIIIDKNIPFINGVLDKIAEVQYLPSKEIDNQAVKNADALIIRTRTVCDEALLRGSKVQFIATATAGTDHIDFDYCAKNGIEIYSAAGCNASSVAQYVGSAMAVWLEKNEKWKMKNGKCTVGIVGWGNVGKEVERLCRALNFNVLKNDPPLQKNDKETTFVSLETICENADIITFHTPLTADGEFATKNLANEQFFQKLKCKPLIINAARGGIVNEKAMLKAYQDGKISDFVIDCWQNEPNISPEIVAQNLLATPHIAGYSADGKANAAQMSIRALSKFFNLNLDDFRVTQLAAKKTVDCKGEELLKILLQNYDIKKDSENLKSNIYNFEFFRNNYFERREIVSITNY